MRYIVIYVIISILFSACVTTIKIVKTNKENTYPQTAKEIKILDSKIDEAYYSLVGTFTSNIEPNSPSHFYNKSQVLRSIPIWKNQKHWFSMALYLMENPQEPIFSGVFQLKKYNIDTFVFNYYDIPKSADVSEIWTDENFLSDYKPSDLIYKKGCSSFLVYKGNDLFEIINDSIPCPCHTTLEGVMFLDMNILLSPTKQIHTNIYYDKNTKTSISYPKISYEREINLGRN